MTTLLLMLALSTADLNEQIHQADKQFFDAFMQCDMQTMQAIYSEDLEFYHDKAGLDDLAETLTATDDLCKKQLGLTRTLVKDRIFPIADFGAIQQGQHRFCHPVGDQQDCGTFEFMHIWKYTPNGWRLHRIISYNH